MEVVSEIEKLKEKLAELREVFGEDERRRELEEIERKLSDNSNTEMIGELLKKKVDIESELDSIKRIQQLVEDAEVYLEMWKEGEELALKEAERCLREAGKFLKNKEIALFLPGEHDSKNAIVTINAGAGGTESMDWAAMLLRMYVKWASKKGFKAEVIDKLEGEEAGIKSVTFTVEGKYAYGLLKGETGVHRLVRISPFDASRRRHTSFAAVYVYPDMEDDEDVEIDTKDLKIETFRASGPGGQYVNMTDTAVRVTHIPTEIVVTCQKERSQYRNKQIALRILKAKLLDLERKKKKKEMEKISGEKKRIEWGNQIRSYTLQPYKLVKDHRTGHEEAKAEEVLDGEIDRFIESFLKKSASG